MRILVISTGGTISCHEGIDGLTPMLTTNDILKKLPFTEKDIIIDGFQLMNIDSANMQPEYWLDIAKQIEHEYERYDGFIITHGTDTLSYTSAALSYLIQHSSKPIVITGSQKPLLKDGTDGEANLRNSVLLCKENIGGIFVVFDNKVILGTQARKIKSKSDDAFISLNKPYAAFINNGNVDWNQSILSKLKSDGSSVRFYRELDVKVAVIKLYPGLNPEIIFHMAEIYNALVIETYGIGSIPNDPHRDFLTAIKKISDTDCIIFICTQMLYEGTNMSLYEVGRKALENTSIIEGGTLSVESAVTKLMWALTISKNKSDIKKLMTKDIAFDGI